MNKIQAHKIYSYIFERLDLTADHRRDLKARGLQDGEITDLGYKSWPLKRSHIVQSAYNEFGDLTGLAGVWKNGSGKWQLAGAIGLCIPVLDKKGDIIAIKIRPDKPLSPKNKYTHLSSNPKEVKGVIKYPGGTAAKVAVHWPKDQEKEFKTVRITEGELKADISTLLGGVYTISVPGVGLWKKAVTAIQSLKEKPEKILIAYDSDKEREEHPEYGPAQGVVNKYDVARHLASLYIELKSIGHNAVIEDWPGQYGKGIDDVLASKKGNMVKEWPEERAKEFCEQHCEKAPSENPDHKWIYIIGTKRFINLSTGLELDKEQYSDTFCHLTPKKNPVDIALRDPNFQRVDLPEFWPNKDQIFHHGGRTYFNTWRSPNLQPRTGEVTTFMEHVVYMLPDERERNILLDYLAYNIQNTGEKVHWAILLQGTQGTGKSYFGHLMRTLLGVTNVSNPSNEAMHENYTQWQSHCALVVVEELMARGRLELMNKLKPMITQDIAVIREMYKPAYEQPNRFNMLMFTNHEDAIIIDKSDRRYCVLFSPAQPKAGDYYKALWNWTGENAAELLGWFQRRDLSNFKAKGHAPMTIGKEKLISESKHPINDWVDQCVETDAWPFISDLISSSHLAACTPNYLGRVSPKALGKAIKERGGVQLNPVRLSTGQSIRLWAVRRQETWATTKSSVVAEEYEKWAEGGSIGGKDYNPLLESKPY